MEKETLQYLAEYVNSISPELWNATINYIYATAFQWTIGGILLLVIGCLLLWLDYKYDLDDGLNGVGYVFGAILIIISICCFGSAIGRFIAPEWYAIKYLLNFNIF